MRRLVSPVLYLVVVSVTCVIVVFARRSGNVTLLALACMALSTAVFGWMLVRAADAGVTDMFRPHRPLTAVHALVCTVCGFTEFFARPRPTAPAA